ncbi:MAG: translation factor Sua5, partial [Alphaproteobacteria bacterium]|nr:translation factor Sua5 [Alphaproteobacteria bacterium]
HAAALKAGATPREALEAVLGPVAVTGDPMVINSPGQLESHYAPGLPVRLNALERRPGEALLGFGATTPDADLNLSPSGDPTEAAANLFAMLRALDRPGFSGLAVAPIPERGLGVAINDRLRRAAAPRPLRSE